MGDEFGCEQVFPFFCNYSDVSESDVLDGRVTEFEFLRNPEERYSPFCQETVDATIIKWPAVSDLSSSASYRSIKQLLGIRQTYIQPLCAESRIVSSDCEENSHKVFWNYRSGERLVFEFSIDEGADIEPNQGCFHHLAGKNWSAGWRIEQ